MTNESQALTDLESLFSQDYSKLYNVAYRMVQTHEEAEDALQNAFIKAFKSISAFRGDSKLSTWVYRIIINECKRQTELIKKLPVTRIVEELNMSEPEFFNSLAYEPTADDLLIVGEMKERCLYAFIHCISQNQRIVFLLSAFLQLPVKEIAEILDMTESNVKTTLHRARKRIQELHAERCSLIDPTKPCKCHLWIKYMKDKGYKLPEGYENHIDTELQQTYDAYKSDLLKINHLYQINARMSKEAFIEKMREKIYSL